MRGGERVPEVEEYPHPWFFVSVASKGLSLAVSLLFATLAWKPISVAAKGLKASVGSNQWTGVGQDIDRKPKSGRDNRARMGGDEHGDRIAWPNQVVKCCAGNGRN